MAGDQKGSAGLAFEVRQLVEYVKEQRGLGYDTIVIFGNPENYVGTGFRNCKHFHVGLGDTYPVALLVKELDDGVLGDNEWNYIESPAFEINDADAEDFDKGFEQMEKAYQPSQELFYIYSRSIVVR